MEIEAVRLPPRNGLFDGVAEGLSVAADPFVPGDYRDHLRRFTYLGCRRDVDRIERANRLLWIRPSGTHQNGFSDAHDIATTPNGFEPANGGAFVLGADASAQSRADQASCRFGKRQRRGDSAPVIDHGSLRGRVLL